MNYLEEAYTFGRSSKFAIDGSVWITNGSDVLKYTRGTKDDFSISGIDKIGEIGEIYTDSDGDKVYIVDKENSAMVVVGKDGLYDKTYNSNDFGRASDVYVDYEENKLYISVGSKVLVGSLTE